MATFWTGFLVGGVVGALVTYAAISVWMVRTLRRMTTDVRQLLERSPPPS
jgi:hypothetical protein